MCVCVWGGDAKILFNERYTLVFSPLTQFQVHSIVRFAHGYSKIFVDQRNDET